MAVLTPLKTLRSHYKKGMPSKGMPAGDRPRRKPFFSFRPLSSDSCCRHTFGNIYGPHKAILINRKRYLFLASQPAL